MTQEEKQLLLKDLCARLPYGIRVLADLDKEFDGGSVGVLARIEPYVGKRYPELKGQYLLYQQGSLTPLTVEECKPYLRPMSSMTEEEKKELKAKTCPNGTGYFDEKYLLCPMNHYGEQISYDFMQSIIDWLNAHHFDYRGLIPMGLALEAPEGMYK